MSKPELENDMAKFLRTKGYQVSIEPDYPSTIDVIARKGDSLLLIEVKDEKRIDASDIAQLKSYGEFFRKQENIKNLVSVFLITPGIVSGSANELSKKFRIDILKPNQINEFYSQEIFKDVKCKP